MKYLEKAFLALAKVVREILRSKKRRERKEKE